MCVKPALERSSAVTTWLLALSMPQYVSVFNRNKWKTLKQVSKLSREELLEGGIKSQHLFKIVDAIAKL
ncbi:hypothetical protein EB796_010733 [Bugula neritina]|uniref:SAM domain-containing protein n=1 Tax=Bugula neritina TaxID=10212 RepID=A0A7J7K041_BUGNE|nr:hypothetical protein EB796_010733 [Bugula neritina]